MNGAGVRLYIASHDVLLYVPFPHDQQGALRKSLSSSCGETLVERPEAAQMLGCTGHEATGCKGALTLVRPRYPQPSGRMEHTFHCNKLSTQINCPSHPLVNCTIRFATTAHNDRRLSGCPQASTPSAAPKPSLRWCLYA